jgi:hypothetical protein
MMAVKATLQTASLEMLESAISPAKACEAARPTDCRSQVQEMSELVSERCKSRILSGLTLIMIPTPKIIPPILPNMIVPASATFIHPMYRNLKSM